MLFDLFGNIAQRNNSEGGKVQWIKECPTPGEKLSEPGCEYGLRAIKIRQPVETDTIKYI